MNPIENKIAIGIDGCASGWIAVQCQPFCFPNAQASFAPSLGELFDSLKSNHFSVIDIPIGLSKNAPIRDCDVAARSLIGPRRSSIFAPPCKKASLARDYPEANSLNKKLTGHGLSKQAWMINYKIKEASKLISSGVNLFEGHPECSFAIINKSPMEEKKSNIRGFFDRIQILKNLGFDLLRNASQLPRKIKAQPDDLIDACILCWSASRHLKKTGIVLPMNRSQNLTEKPRTNLSRIHV